MVKIGYDARSCPIAKTTIMVPTKDGHPNPTATCWNTNCVTRGRGDYCTGQVKVPENGPVEPIYSE